MQNNQPQGLSEGIYFNLSEETYHNDPAISNSDIKKLLVSPMKYWRNSSLNPKRKFKETPSLKLGKALHCYLMERERFYRDYIVLPKLDIDSDFYRIESEKVDFFQNFALRKTKDAKTFEYIGGKIKLSKEEFEEIKERVDYFQSLPTAGALFQDGYMEVSIFWRDEETGLMCKCRMDWLALLYIADYKSLEDVKKIKNQIGEYDYYIQAAYYLEGLKNFKKNPKCHDANEEQKEFVKELVSMPDAKFVFAFQEKEDLMVRLKMFREDVIESAESLFRQALNTYKINIEKYGVKPWEDNYKKPGEDDIEILGWEDLPAWVQYKYL